MTVKMHILKTYVIIFLNTFYSIINWRSQVTVNIYLNKTYTILNLKLEYTYTWKHGPFNLVRDVNITYSGTGFASTMKVW